VKRAKRGEQCGCDRERSEKSERGVARPKVRNRKVKFTLFFPPSPHSSHPRTTQPIGVDLSREGTTIRHIEFAPSWTCKSVGAKGEGVRGRCTMHKCCWMWVVVLAHSLHAPRSQLTATSLPPLSPQTVHPSRRITPPTQVTTAALLPGREEARRRG
jgi:hypothetical protein